MTNVYWSFGEKYESLEEFEKAVEEYNNNISDDHMWDPNEVVIDSEKAIIFFEALWKDEDDILEVEIKAKDGKALKMGEVLFQLTNASSEFFKGADAKFFEGLSDSGEKEGNKPIYHMWIGS